MSDKDAPLHKWHTAIPSSPKRGLFFSVARWAAVLPMASVGLEDDLPYATQDSQEWSKISRIALFPELSVPEDIEKKDGCLAIELDSGRKGWVSDAFVESGRLIIEPEDTLFVIHMKELLEDKGWKPFYLCQEDIKRLCKEAPPSFSEHLLPYDPVSPRFWYGQSCETCGQPYDIGNQYDMCNACDEPRIYSPSLNLGTDYE